MSSAVDFLVGSAIRARRKELGMTQQQLAEKIGVSFQQLQKYEKAFNRVSASKLWEISSALAVPPNYFFEGVPSVKESIEAGRQTGSAVQMK